MWRRTIVCGFCGVLSSLAYGRTWEDIEKSKELRVCLSSDPGIAWMENNQWTGPAFEIITLFAEKHQLKPVYRAIDWDEQFFNHEGKYVSTEEYMPKAFATKECDVYPSNLTKKPWREKLMDFVEVFESRLLILVRNQEKKKYLSKKDLEGKMGIVQKMTTFDNYITEMNRTEMFIKKPMTVKYVEDGTAYDVLEKGEGDFSVADADMGMYLTKWKNKSLVGSFMVGSPDSIGWGIPKDSTKFKSVANLFFKEQKGDKNSSFQEIWKKYYGLDFHTFQKLIKAMK